jgi:hypothetical protein
MNIKKKIISIITSLREEESVFNILVIITVLFILTNYMDISFVLTAYKYMMTHIMIYLAVFVLLVVYMSLIVYSIKRVCFRGVKNARSKM